MSDQEKPFMTNAADPKQVKSAGQREKNRENEFLDALSSVTDTIQGRRVMWDFLEECSVFESIWEASAKIHYKAGKQDMGHWIVDKLIQASEDNYVAMERENRKRKREEMNVRSKRRRSSAKSH